MALLTCYQLLSATLFICNVYGQASTDSAPVTVQTIGSYQYVGCYSDKGSQRALSAYIPPQPSSGGSVEYCASQCIGYQLFGVEYANECYCGNTITEGTTLSSGCDMVCGGNTSEYCGAANLLDIYSLNGDPPTVPATVQVIGNYSYLGCYTEATNERALTGYSPAIPTTGGTVEYCESQCNGYQYFGVEYGNECYCGNIINTGSVVSSGCNMVCGGNASEYCGAGNRLDMYELTSLTCPASNGTIFTVATSNAKFRVECAVDYQGGDLGMVYVSDIVECINACANTTGCIDVSLRSNACYMKQTLGAAVADSGIIGAKLYTGN